MYSDHTLERANNGHFHILMIIYIHTKCKLQRKLLTTRDMIQYAKYNKLTKSLPLFLRRLQTLTLWAKPKFGLGGF